VLREATIRFADALRDTTRALNGTIKTAHRGCDLAQAVEDAARRIKKCPECGELAIRATPNDLTAQQRDQGIRPTYAHHDRSQLCPVIGDHGYEPAQPVPATFTL
jgi:hypothetical protein